MWLAGLSGSALGSPSDQFWPLAATWRTRRGHGPRRLCRPGCGAGAGQHPPAGRMAAGGGRCTGRVPGVAQPMHVFQIAAPMVPEADRSSRHIGNYIREATDSYRRVTVCSAAPINMNPKLKSGLRQATDSLI